MTVSPAAVQSHRVRRGQLWCAGKVVRTILALVQIQPRVANVAQALPRILLQTAVQKPANVGRRRRRQLFPVGFALEYVRECGRYRLAREGRAGGHISYSTQSNDQISARLSVN